MKYSIDMHLKRYESALEHISRVPDKFEECLNLICNQNLYTRAINLFEKDSAEYKRVAGIFGEYLLNKKMYQEAAIMFYKSEDFSKALNAYMLAGNWQDVIIISVNMKLSPADLREIYSKLVERLKADKNYKDAAKISRYYLNDVEEAVVLLCEGRCWIDAIQLTQEIQRLDLNETHVIPGINDHAEHVISQLFQVKQDFMNYKTRLAIVRTEINEKRMLMSTNNAIAYSDEPTSSRGVTDFLSDTSSIAGSVSVSSQRSQISTASGRSYRSSKNRRKQERKLFSLKEGSMFEDLGLIHALYQLISTVNKDKDEWHELVKALLHFEFIDFADTLQNKIISLFQLIKSSKSEIWNKSVPTSLAEIEKMTTYTPAQLQEITAYFKVVEPYITHPPESNDITQLLHLWDTL